MSGFADFDRYDGLGLAELVRRREVSAEEIARRRRIARVEARNPAINAVVTPHLRPGAGRARAPGLPTGRSPACRIS